MEGGEKVCELADESALQVWQSELARNAKLNLRPEIGLNPEFFPLVLNGSKTTTVRYSKGCIHFPQHTTLPLIISTTRGSLFAFPLAIISQSSSDNYLDNKGDVIIKKVVIKRFRDLNDEDAKKGITTPLTDLYLRRNISITQTVLETHQNL